MDSPNLSRAVWRKSARSQPEGQNCVELASLDDSIAVRDSKDPDGPRLLLTHRAWRDLAASIKNGTPTWPEISHVDSAW